MRWIEFQPTSHKALRKKVPSPTTHGLWDNTQNFLVSLLTLDRHLFHPLSWINVPISRTETCLVWRINSFSFSPSLTPHSTTPLARLECSRAPLLEVFEDETCQYVQSLHSHRGYDNFYHFNLVHAARHCLARLCFFFFRKWTLNSREICCNWFCIQLICRYSDWLIRSYFHGWFLPKLPFCPFFLLCALVWCMCIVYVHVHTNGGSQDLKCSVLFSWDKTSPSPKLS